MNMKKINDLAQGMQIHVIDAIHCKWFMNSFCKYFFLYFKCNKIKLGVECSNLYLWIRFELLVLEQWQKSSCLGCVSALCSSQYWSRQTSRPCSMKWPQGGTIVCVWFYPLGMDGTSLHLMHTQLIQILRIYHSAVWLQH